ncbi:MAG: hypothetical protein HY650_09015 [Acidobacteria bacterium]|nr:hypothetical protein [Acidobacteriota bacterium]
MYYNYMVPRELRALFWDTNLDHFDPQSFPDYVIARVLELGDKDPLHWLKGAFDEDQIVRVIRTERRLTRRSANFWALVYHIPTREVAALNPVT